MLGQPAELDLARPVTWAPKRRLVATTVEVDLATALVAPLTRLISRAEEQDVAFEIIWAGQGTPYLRTSTTQDTPRRTNRGLARTKYTSQLLVDA